MKTNFPPSKRAHDRFGTGSLCMRDLCQSGAKPGRCGPRPRTQVRPLRRADLDALNVAIGKMKALSCDDQQAGISRRRSTGYPMTRRTDLNLKNGNPFCASYNGTTAALNSGWDTWLPNSGMGLHFLVGIDSTFIPRTSSAPNQESGFCPSLLELRRSEKRRHAGVFAKKISQCIEPSRCTVLNQGKPIESKEYRAGPQPGYY